MIALMWANYGPYHVARARALARVSDIAAIEFADTLRLIGWAVDRQAADFEIQTLTRGAWEDQNQWLLAAKLCRRLQKIRPSALLVPGCSTIPTFCAALWGRLHGRLTVLMSESTREDHPRVCWKEVAKGWLLRLLFARAIVGGKRSAAYLTLLGFPSGRIAYGYDVVDNEFFSTRTAQLRSAARPSDYGLPENYFLFVGRLAPEKNVSGLIRAFSTFRHRRGHWSLVIVGDGPLARTLRKHASASVEADRVVFAGFKNGTELLPFYAFAGCFVLPSIREPWGLVVNEAMASGLPVIVSSPCGCSDDLVRHGYNGFVFDPTNPVDMAEHLLRMSRLADEDRAAMGRKSSEIIAGYSLERWAAEVLRTTGHTQKDSVSLSCRESDC